MERYSGRVALVTGASVGIGAAIAERLVKAGMTTVGCARNIKTIEEQAEKLKSEKGKLIAIKCDLTKEEEIMSMFEEIKTKYGGVDVCINNAGLARPGPLFSGKYDGWRNMLDVNVMALAICSQEAFKSMKARGVDDGMIIHISSIAGHYVGNMAMFHFYCATKHAVRALTDGMRNELREAKSNIRVAAISPGAVETEFAPRAVGQEMANQFYAANQLLQAGDIADMVEYIMAAPPQVSAPLVDSEAVFHSATLREIQPQNPLVEPE